MGTNSARPDNLDAFSSGTRTADAELKPLREALVGAIAEFTLGSPDVRFDADSLMTAFETYLDANHRDADWVSHIATAFRIAGGVGRIGLPDAALEAVLRAAGLDGGRTPISFDDPIALGVPPTSGYANDPVNTATGNFVEVESDLLHSGLLRLLVLERTYNSRSDGAGPFGPRWSSWASARLLRRPDGVEYEGPDGQRATFPSEGEGYGRVVGINALVEATESGLSLAWFGGERWDFDAAGRPTAISAGPGTRVDFRHDDDGHLTELTHVRGRRVGVRWEGERIVALESSDGRSAAYRYDDAGHLVEAEGVAGQRRYAIDGAGLIESVTDADGVVELVNTYDEHGRVLTQLSPFGRHTTFTYLPGNVTVTSDKNDGPTSTYLHDRAGRLIGVVDGHEQTFRKNYDDWGNPVAIIDRNGAVTVQEWDERARLVRQTLPMGASFEYRYDEADRLVSVTAGTGEQTRFRYSGAERTPSEVVDPEGAVTAVAVTDGLVTRIADADGVVIEFRYDGDGNLVEAVDGEGGVARIERDIAGNPVAAVTPSGRRTEFAFDWRGLLVERRDPTGGVWRFEYSQVGRPLAVVDPLGARTETRYGAHGEAAETVDALGASTSREYDVFGSVSSVFGPDGVKWTFAYDALCRLSALTDPAGATWLREYDAEGHLVGYVDPVGVRLSATVDQAGRVTRLDDGLTAVGFAYDELGRLLTRTRPDGSQLRATYDRCGRVVTETGPGGATTRYKYSPAGRPIRVTAPSGRTEAYEYDRCGRVSAWIDGAGKRWELRYDADGALVERVAPTGEAQTFTYDGAGRLATRSVPGTGLTTYAYDAVGRVVTIAGGAAGTMRFEYDPAGRPVHAVDGNGRSTSYAYNAYGLITRVTDPLGGTEAWEYDAVGRPLSHTDQLGRTTTIAYDAAGRRVERVSGAGERVQWSYDRSGRVETINGGAKDRRVVVEWNTLGLPVGVSEFGSFRHELRWDGADRLVERRRDDMAVGWTYDADGSCTSLRHPDGSVTSYEHDATGCTTSFEHPLLGRVRLERDDAGRLIGVHGNGMDTTWRYADGVLVGHEVRHGGTTTRTSLARDSAGRVVSVDVDGRPRRFEYDAAGQLVRASGAEGDQRFEYDANGRLVRESGAVDREYSYDAAGQLLTAGERSFAFDGSGNRTTETSPDGQRDYEWDWLGRLAGIRTTGDDGKAHRTSVTVDALGELAEVDGTPFMWDTADPFGRLVSIGSSAVIGDDRPWAVAGPGGAATWAAADWQGSVGGPTADVWGAASRGPRLGYRCELEVDGLVWLRNRAYEPASRSFLSVDPLAALPGTPYAGNPYHYAGNDPTNSLDPLGLRPLTDADLQGFREQKGRGGWAGVTKWVQNNWEYVAGGVLVIGGLAVLAIPAITTAGVVAVAVLGSALFGAGWSILEQRLQGAVNWRKVGIDTAWSVAFAPVGGPVGRQAFRLLAKSAPKIGSVLGKAGEGIGRKAGDLFKKSGPIFRSSAKEAAEGVLGEVPTGMVQRALDPDEKVLDSDKIRVDVFKGVVPAAAHHQLMRFGETRAANKIADLGEFSDKLANKALNRFGITGSPEHAR